MYVREISIGNLDHGFIGGQFHVRGAFLTLPVLVVCHYWHDCLPPFLYDYFFNIL